MTFVPPAATLAAPASAAPQTSAETIGDLVTGFAIPRGTFLRPYLELRIHPKMTVPGKQVGMVDWVRSLGQSVWDPSAQSWRCYGVGSLQVTQTLLDAGLQIRWGQRDSDLAGVLHLDELAAPIAKLSDDGSTVLVRHRLAGLEKCRELIGHGSVLDQGTGLLRMSPGDVVLKDPRTGALTPRPHVHWTDACIDAGEAMHRFIPVPEHLGPLAAWMGSALDIDTVRPDNLDLIGDQPHYPRAPFPYQYAGAYAVAAGRTCLFDEPGVGKAQPLSEPVLTPSGWRTMGELLVGDEVIGSDGSPTVVLGVFPQGEMEVYRITFSDGSYTRATGDHLWSVRDRRFRNNAAKRDRTLTTQELIEEGLTVCGSTRFSIPMVAPVTYQPGPALPLDPYLLGVLLGDGGFSGAHTNLTTDDEIVNGLRLPDGAYSTLTVRVSDTVATHRLAGVRVHLSELGLSRRRSERKFIPGAYLRAAVADRVALLQGLLDTDGWACTDSSGNPRSTVQYGTSSPQLADDVVELVQSLGGVATRRVRTPHYRYKGQSREGLPFHSLVINLPEGVTPFRLRRKAANWKPRTKYPPSRRIVSIEPDGREAAQCIRVAAADHLYVTRGFVVTHNTAQALMAARILRARRVLIVCPPLLTSNWARECALAGLTGPAPADDPKLSSGLPEPVVIRPGRKEPHLPEEGVVIVSDSLLAARPETADRIIAWGSEVMIVDEAHRLKTLGSARSDAVLRVGRSARHAPIAITGTPVFAAPHEMLPLLELTRFLVPIFGGRHPFLDDFARQDRMGNWKPKIAALPRLKAMLTQHVWVRRRKIDVLPQLPPKRRRELVLDVPLTEYRTAHKETIAKIQGWITWFNGHYGRMPLEEDYAAYAERSGFELISQMRRAAGRVKVKAAIELIVGHVRESGFETTSGAAGEVKTYNRPLIVWAHHLDVIRALLEALPAELGHAAAIYGDTSDADRDRIVAEFQQGRIPVLVAGITKAGVGITLTRSSDAFFIETDWTPALLVQAEDRTHRIGQENPSNYTTLVARGTLDELIQRVLIAKTKVTDALFGDHGGSVAVLAHDDTQALSDLVAALIAEAAASWKPAPASADPAPAHM